MHRRVAPRANARKKTQRIHHRRPSTAGFWTRSPDPCETSPHVIAVTEDRGLLPPVLTLLSAVHASVADRVDLGQATGEPPQERFGEPANTHPDKNMREAMLLAIGLGVGSLLGEEQRFYPAECVPQQKLDFLLYVRLVRHLLERHDRVGRILAGDYRDDWLPPELQDLCDGGG
jgi:hypothetical protein